MKSQSLEESVTDRIELESEAELAQTMTAEEWDRYIDQSEDVECYDYVGAGMTIDMEKAEDTAKNHDCYMRHRKSRLEKQKSYYQRHREEIKRKNLERYYKKKAEAMK